MPDTDNDSGTSNDVTSSGDKVAKRKGSKLKRNVDIIFPSETETSSKETCNVSTANANDSDKCNSCVNTHKCRKCRKTIRWNRSRIAHAEDDLNLRTIEEVCYLCSIGST